MARISTPADIGSAPHASQALLNGVKQSLGSVPNLFRLVSNSPAALEGYLGLNNALGKGQLDAAIRERLALAVAEINGCNYCLSAHSYLAKNVAKLSDEEITANRRGSSSDEKANKAVRFAADLTRNRGQIGAERIDELKAVGYSEAEIVEIVAHVALNTLTNYVNEAFKTEIDFPRASPLTADELAA